MPLDVARRGTLDVRDPPLKAIVAANDNYEAGYHKGNAGGLDAIDADLATANIKNGITIFGKVGSADVHDISDATAVEAEVIAPETFYAVGGGIRTGTMPIVALAPGSSAYPAGYHAGDGGGLPAVDGDLVTANIKNGITIFNIPGDVDVRDVSDANALVGEVMNGRTFYAVGGARKTGTLPTRTLNPANENVLAGYYAGTTLSTVEVQLAAANILSGVNIFGFVGVATVRDIADADALVGQVLNPATFYSVTGARKTGTMATVALAPGSNAYPAGYHVGAANLAAVDGDLATANIKNGITIFNINGSVDVRDVSDANALVGEVMNGRTFYAVGGARKTGTLATVAIVAGSNAYPAGYHAGDGGGLSAIDADLAVGNIKSGVVIFGFTGTFTNTGSPPVAGDVKNGKVCWANGVQINGNMPTVALAPGSSAYPAGYHAGHGGGLPAIDADLATGNIKFGITIFNIAGHTNVRDSTDANAVLADVKNGKTFYAGGGARKTGNLATVALAADNSAYPAGYHAGAASLQAVDAHLTPANIKLGVNIFGYVGTLSATLAEDVLGDAQSALTGWDAGLINNKRWDSFPAETEIELVSLTQTYNDPSLTVASAVLLHQQSSATFTFRLYMDGVMVAESPNLVLYEEEVLMATRAMAGVDKICKACVYNSAVSSQFLYIYSEETSGKADCFIMAGSVKV